MPFTFRKSFQILPGVRLNINRRTTSMNLPGGFGWRKTTTRRGQEG